ncbi:MAG: hypothetical protein KJZ54_03570 [Phycisphaerales bacterium]|nr:hypothetical protein [Phycisphaerales bacterium]
MAFRSSQAGVGVRGGASAAFGACHHPLRAWGGWVVLLGSHWRGCRVAVLMAAVVVMSLADLAMTMTYLNHVGMIESNPLARIVMHGGGPGSLVAWKLASTALAVGILLRLRRRGVAEFAALLCCAVLVWLMVRWVAYVEAAPALAGALAAMPEHVGDEWVSFAQPLGGS